MTQEAKKVDIQSSEPTPTQSLSPLDDVDRWMDQVSRSLFHPSRWEWPSMPSLRTSMPKVDIVDRDSEVLIRAEVPGVKKDDLDVSMTDHSITIKGSTRHEEKEEKGDYYRHEISKGSFSRTLTLPGDVDINQAKSSFADGVLEITVPKMERAKRRSINID
jgi:HSP20 family protein